jgi:Ca2+-binding EF-hand superfamily protein
VEAPVVKDALDIQLD